jgi:hypothetical protein
MPTRKATVPVRRQGGCLRVQERDPAQVHRGQRGVAAEAREQRRGDIERPAERQRAVDVVELEAALDDEDTADGRILPEAGQVLRHAQFGPRWWRRRDGRGWAR